MTKVQLQPSQEHLNHVNGASKPELEKSFKKQKNKKRIRSQTSSTYNNYHDPYSRRFQGISVCRPAINPPRCLVSTINVLNRYAMPVTVRERTISNVATLIGLTVGASWHKNVYVIPLYFVVDRVIRTGITILSDRPYRNRHINISF